jgi:geranylgeranyl diphosphate synthase type II
VIKLRIERALESALNGCEARGAPPKLAAALRHAVWPGGARVRPQLCLAVAAACGDGAPALADGAAAAIELLHCASLVHDDLPCFDDAPLRRGLPSVHAKFGERLAVLAGDALIVLAFEVLARAAAAAAEPGRLPAMTVVLAARVGAPFGIVAGQAWECEDWVALPDYQRAKTGSLFAAATELGALAAGGAPERWREFGEHLGEAYQVADDIRDVAADAQWLGKPVGRDFKLGRPNAVAALGMEAALAHFDALVERSAAAVPAGPGAKGLRQLLQAEAQRLLPPALLSRHLGAHKSRLQSHHLAPQARSAA